MLPNYCMSLNCKRIFIQVTNYWSHCRCYPINTALADPIELDRKLREYSRNPRVTGAVSDSSDSSSGSSDSDSSSDDDDSVRRIKLNVLKCLTNVSGLLNRIQTLRRHHRKVKQNLQPESNRNRQSSMESVESATNHRTSIGTTSPRSLWCVPVVDGEVCWVYTEYCDYLIN